MSREAFESLYPVPNATEFNEQYNEYRYIDFKSVNAPHNAKWEAFCDGWLSAKAELVTDLESAIKQKRGMTGIRETAKHIGISPTTLSKVENGHFPDARTQAKLCKWLGLRIALMPIDIP